MNLFIFSFFVVTCTIQAFAYIATYPATASYLKSRIQYVLTQVSRTLPNVDEHLKNINKISFSFDTTYIVSNLKVVMNRKQHKPGYSNCSQLYKDKMTTLRSSVLDVGRNGLFKAAIKLNNITSSLENIRKFLSGAPLVDQIRQCQKSPKQCNLTGAFERTVQDAENYIKDNLKILQSPRATYRIIDRDLPVGKLIERIEDILVDPVYRCLEFLG